MRHLILSGFLIVCLAAAAAAADKVVTPFNGTTLEGWAYKGSKEKSKWVVGRATLDEKDPKKLAVAVLPTEADGGPGVREMVNKEGSVDIYTEQKFGDCTIELEFMIPKDSNSGVYVMGEYEVQILDSFGKDKVGPGDLGGLYNNAAPK